MNIEVTKDLVKILENSDLPNENEYRITTCNFIFDEFTDSFQVKRAIFTVISTDEMYETDIINDECYIPVEVLEHEYEKVKLGVYGFNIETIDGEEVLKERFSPSYAEFVVPTGSYEEGALSPEIITPTQYDIYSEALQEGLNEVNDKLDELVDTVDGKIEEIDEAIENAERLDIDAEKTGKITSITITRQDGTTKDVTLEDGMGLNYIWRDTELGIKREDEQEYVYVDLQGPKGDAGAIKMLIVAELPETGADDTIYLVPLEEPDVQGNNYAEYVYIDNQWELLGKIGVQVDLTDYVKNTDYATNVKGGVLKTGNGTYLDGNGIIVPSEYSMSSYNDRGRNTFISKGTLENVITGKGLVSNTDYATDSVAGVLKTEWGTGTYVNSNNGKIQARVADYATYNTLGNATFIGKGTLDNVLDAKIGDIQTLLDNLNTGSGV